MEKTFEDKLPHPDQDQQRRLDNAVRSEKGEPQIGGSAGRQQVADKTTSEHDQTTGGPGSQASKPVQDPTV